MAHYLQHIALTAAAASFTQTVSTWLSPADLNLLIKTQWAHFKSSALRSRSAAGQKRGLEMTMLMSFFVLPLIMAYEDCGETAASLYEKDVKLFILLGFAASLHYAAVFGNNCYFYCHFQLAVNTLFKWMW